MEAGIPPASDERDDPFDAVMRSMGVRRIDAPRGKGKPKKQASKAPRGPATPPAARPASAEPVTPTERVGQQPASPGKPGVATSSGKPVGATSPGKPGVATSSGKPVGATSAGKPVGATSSGKPVGATSSGKPCAHRPAGARGGHPSAAARSAPARAGSASDTALLLGEIDRLRADLAELEPLRARLAAAEAALQDQQAAQADLARLLEQARSEAEAAAQAASARGAERDELAQALDRLSEQGDGPQPLLAVLRQRGVVGETEAEQLLTGLAQERVLAPLLELLATPRPEAVARLLAHRVLLTGDCPACPTLPGRVHLRLPAARCELCHGADLRRAVRRFYDGALVTGLTRLVLVGGTARDHLVLRGLLDDRRVELLLVHGGLRRTADEVAHDLAAARAVVLWRHPENEPDALEAYTAFAGPRIELEAPDLAAFLEAAGSGLQGVYD